jgi:hypothetical protein
MFTPKVMDMKKEILLAIGVAALYAAAKEYGINSVADIRRLASPYLKLLDLGDLGDAGGRENGQARRTPAKAGASRGGNHRGNH